MGKFVLNHFLSASNSDKNTNIIAFLISDSISSPVLSSEEKRRKKESGRNKPAFSRTQRRKHEDHLAMIFLGFIFVFLLCHLPRILLDIHELVTREHYITCRQFHHHDFPAYISISIFISHVMLVISSATNLLIYCSLSSTYRKEVLDFFAQTYSKIRESIYKPWIENTSEMWCYNITKCDVNKW